MSTSVGIGALESTQTPASAQQLHTGHNGGSAAKQSSKASVALASFPVEMQGVMQAEGHAEPTPVQLRQAPAVTVSIFPIVLLRRLYMTTRVCVSLTRSCMVTPCILTSLCKPTSLRTHPTAVLRHVAGAGLRSSLAMTCKPWPNLAAGRPLGTCCLLCPSSYLQRRAHKPAPRLFWCLHGEPYTCPFDLM